MTELDKEFYFVHVRKLLGHLCGYQVVVSIMMVGGLLFAPPILVGSSLYYSLRLIITESFTKKKCPKITESFHFSIQH